MQAALLSAGATAGALAATPLRLASLPGAARRPARPRDAMACPPVALVSAPLQRGVFVQPRDHGTKFGARIWLGPKVKKYEYIGKFDTVEAAARAYDERARQLGFSENKMNYHEVADAGPAAPAPPAHRAAAKRPKRYKGVSETPEGKFRATVTVNHFVGDYATAEEAARAHDERGRAFAIPREDLNFTDDDAPSARHAALRATALSKVASR